MPNRTVVKIKRDSMCENVYLAYIMFVTCLFPFLPFPLSPAPHPSNFFSFLLRENGKFKCVFKHGQNQVDEPKRSGQKQPEQKNNLKS